VPELSGWEKATAEMLGEAITHLAGFGLLRPGMQVTGYHALANVPPFGSTMVVSAPFDRKDRAHDLGGRRVTGLTYWTKMRNADFGMRNEVAERN